MPGEITITIGLRWKWQDGDGLACCNCGDIAYLKQLQMFAVIDEVESPQDIILCSSCGEALNLATE